MIKKLKFYFRKVKKFILDIIFPIECLNCGKEGTWLCDNCKKKIILKEKQYCFNCKIENDFGHFCFNCKKYYALNGIFIASDYENEIVAKVIRTLKYKFIQEMAEILSQILVDFIEKMKNDKKSVLPPYVLRDLENVLVTSVPLYYKRLHWRGFNQAELIAKSFSHKLNLEFDPNLLLRVKHNKPQVELPEMQRKINLKNSFKLINKKKVKDRNIIIIDDVATTGSTLNECAKALRQNKKQEIWGLVVAKG